MTITTLIQVLEPIPPGVLTKDVCDRVISLLRECWQEFSGSDETFMQPRKLHRAEQFQSNSPFLSFAIERHGATMLGSTRAELQRWEPNLTTQTARCFQQSYRQLERASPKVDVKPIAARVCETVRQGRKPKSDLVRNGVIEWRGDDEVWIYHGKLIPDEGYAQTVAGRRKRFRKELTNIMKPFGWKLLKVRQAMVFTKED
jgi:hypothetical protein